jgi:RNA polymerase sigma-70 factor (ECF subfamily)
MRAVYALGYGFFRNADDADDVAQETFVRAYQALDRYDARFTFYTWLRTIATRVALNEIAKRRRRRTEGGESFETAAETVAGETPDPIDTLSAAELQGELQVALAGVPPEYRAVLVLRAQDGLSYAEIAAILDIPPGTVMSRLHRARALVRRALGTQGGIEPDREERR